jgi:hypothetical protein
MTNTIQCCLPAQLILSMATSGFEFFEECFDGERAEVRQGPAQALMIPVPPREALQPRGGVVSERRIVSATSDSTVASEARVSIRTALRALSTITPQEIKAASASMSSTTATSRARVDHMAQGQRPGRFAGVSGIGR